MTAADRSHTQNPAVWFRVAALVALGATSVLGRPAAFADGERCPPAEITAQRAEPRPAPPRSGPAAPAPTSRCLTGLTRTCVAPTPPCDRDVQLAKIAWKYFETNYQASTGLVNSVDGYPSTTMWDTASATAATIAAAQLGLITNKELDDRITAVLATLLTMRLYRDEIPNKVYNATTAQMVDYTNKNAADGIGYSALDIARLTTILDMLSCLYPRHAAAAKRVLHRWNYCRAINEGQMFGAAFNRTTGEEAMNQEGRIGYEQYGARGWRRLGFDVRASESYRGPNTQTIKIEGVPIVYDVRDPRKFGAFNFVVTESYALEALEYGISDELAPLLRAIYEVQKRRHARTGIVTAVSEDNIDREPWFVYNTIFAAGTPWNAITDTGRDMTALKTTSVKAAIALAVLFPADDYSRVLFDKIASAHDPAKGWYSGVYENGSGFNKAITANTNGIVLESLLYKMYGPLVRICDRCGHDFVLKPFDDEQPADVRGRCFPGTAPCDSCQRLQATARLKPLPPRPAPASGPPAAPPAAPAPAPAAPPAKTAPPTAPTAPPPAPTAPPPAKTAPPPAKAAPPPAKAAPPPAKTAPPPAPTAAPPAKTAPPPAPTAAPPAKTAPPPAKAAPPPAPTAPPTAPTAPALAPPAPIAPPTAKTTPAPAPTTPPPAQTVSPAPPGTAALAGTPPSDPPRPTTGSR